MLVKHIPDGSIIWYKEAVIGIKGATLPSIFDDCGCFACGGNEFDYEMYPQDFNEEQMDFIDQAYKEWFADEEEEPENEDEHTEYERTEAPGELDFDAPFDLPDDDLPF